jgi:hypothetical protein
VATPIQKPWGIYTRAVALWIEEIGRVSVPYGARRISGAESSLSISDDELDKQET